MSGKTIGIVDLHTHLLPHMDDGSKDTAISFAMQYLRIMFRSWLWMPLRNTVLTPSSMERFSTHSAAEAIRTT